MTPTTIPTSATSPDVSTELGLHVRKWRTRLDPDQIPGSNRRRKKRVSQESLATLVGYSANWIRSLEHGELKNYGPDFLDRLAVALRLNVDEKRVLFLLATGHEPALQSRPSQMPSPSIVQRIVDGQPWPAYVNDEAWDVIAYNEQMAKWFPWLTTPETNIMRWTFLDPEARKQLHRWETDWAPQMLAQLRYAHMRFPDHPRLDKVVDDVLHDDTARRMWDNPISYIHPDGDRRKVVVPWIPDARPIELVAMELMRVSGSRVLFLMPLDAADEA